MREAPSQRKNEAAKATELAQWATRIRHRALGDKHPETGDAFSLLGRIAQENKSPDIALKQYTSALGIYKAAFGTEHAKVALTLTNIARVKSVRRRRAV